MKEESITTNIIIIGGGIAGLAAGCYAQMHGYRTRIFELHTVPGGLCTSWKRNGYTIDGCIHWLIGAGSRSGLHPIWQELGAIQDRPMVYHEEFMRFQDPDGEVFVIYTDIDRLEQHMKTRFPNDAALVAEYAQAARRFTHIDLFALPLLKPAEALRLVPFAGALARWGRITMQGFAERFSDSFLRRVFPLIHGHPPLPMAAHLANLAAWHTRSAGWPIGGSLPFSKVIERRYRHLGGEIHYGSRVERILVEPVPQRRPGSHQAVGVRLADGTEHRADVIVSAADGHTTIFDMLGGTYVNDQIRTYYDGAPNSQEHGILVSLGVDRDLSSEPRAVTYLLDRPVLIAGERRERLTVEHYSFDPTMAPPGKSVIEIWLDSSYAYWSDLHPERQRYEAEKQEVASAAIAELEKHHPGISDQIEVVDVATPITLERYTGSWRGLEAWFPKTNGLGIMLRGLSRTLPGLDNFHMVGQWAGAAGGLPMAAISARKLIQTLCRRDRRPLEVQLPVA